MRKQILIKGESKELSYEECLIEYHGLINILTAKYKRIIPMEKEDFNQEVLMAAWKAYRFYNAEHGTQFSTILGKVIINHLYKILRDIKKDKRKANIGTSSLDQSVVDDEQFIPKNLLTYGDDFTETMEIKDYLNQSDEMSQKIIKLLYAGYSQREIGKILGCGQVSVSRYRRKNVERLRAVC